MLRYFMRIALALAVIAASEMVLCKERCFLLCDRMKSPGPKLPYSLVQCDDNQVCMQTMNYTLDITMMDSNNKRKDAIFFLHRYCVAAQACREHCRMATVQGGANSKIMVCVTCMNSTTFGPEGKLVSQMICHDESGPVVERIDKRRRVYPEQQAIEESAQDTAETKETENI